MDEHAALNKLVQLLDADDMAAADTSTWTSVSLRDHLEMAVAESALQLHYQQHPGARPLLTEVAVALACQDRSALADQLDLIAAAAATLERHCDPDADDVLLHAQPHLPAV